MIYWVILILIAYAILSSYSLKLGVYSIILFLPVYLIRFSVFGIPMTLLESMILILFIMWLVRLFRDNKKIFKTRKQYFKFVFSYLSGYKFIEYEKDFKKLALVNKQIYKIRPYIFLFLGAGILGFLVAQDSIAAAGILKAYIFEPILFFIVVSGVIKTESDIRRFVYTLGVLSVSISIYGILQYIYGFGLLVEKYQGMEIKRITSFFEYPNAIGLLVAPIIGMYFVLFLDEVKKGIIKNYKKIIWVVFVILVGIVSIMLARTEAALGALAIVGVLVGLFYNSSVLRGITILFILISVIFFGFNADLRGQFIEKITLKDFSGHVRMHTYKESWEMLNHHMVFGAGLSGYQEAMMPFHQDIIWIGDNLQPVEIYLYPHNIVLNFWTEMGFLGVVAFVLLLIFVIKNCIKYRKVWMSQSVLAGLLVLVIHGVFDVPYFKNDLAVLFWVFMALQMTIMNFDTKTLKGYNISTK